MHVSPVQTKVWAFAVVATAIAGALIAVAFLSATPAQAHTDPATCDSTGVSLSLTVLRADGTTPVGGGMVAVGETIKYRATLSHSGGTNCNYQGGDLDIITPDGVNHDVDGGTIPLVSTSSPFVGTIVTYVVSAADIGGDNDLDASAIYSSGTSHLGGSDVSPVGATTPAATLVSGSITVDKVTDPSGSSQSFTFTTSGSGYSGFSLTDAATPNMQTLAPGTYTVNETLPGGWILSGATCASNGTGTTTYTPGSNLVLDGGENIFCTFNNQQQSGRIIVIKQTTPDATSTQFEFDPSWGANFMLSDGQQNDSGSTTPGTYSVAEINLPANWSLASSSCSDGSPVNNISLSNGEVVTCTFNNVFTPPAIEWCSPGYWRNHLDEAAIAAAAGGFSLSSTYASQFGSAPPLSKKAQKDGASANPTLLQVLQSPQWYGGAAFNNVADLLSENHPDIEFNGTRVEDGCPLN
jgi:hypothetical protein